ncbi:hypothetical protein [Allobranchiibius sp. GilTou73]|uniref:hypothetical protein n=1 Tax=Allobranchiibius sp. GilTou73 TaxID=2904523 RepID=UPI001F1BEF0B|nr:hypothetical protein [Allobranchiibius sp. GilTou73]UIJ36332.1 hypothetical protein LVQ62_08205 [Allobranchiibius sp. GilTou73]
MSITSTLTRTAATATLLALPLGLTACGGSSDKVSVSSSSSSSSSSSASSAPSSTTSSSSSSAPASTTPSSTSASSSAAAGGGKPTKAAATAGLAKGLEQTAQGAKLKPAVVQKISACIVDKTYDKVSASAVKAYAAADKNARLDSKDNAIYLAAAAACGKELGLRK